MTSRSMQVLAAWAEYSKGTEEELEQAVERGAKTAQALFEKTGKPLCFEDEFSGQKIHDAEAMGWNSVVLSTHVLKVPMEQTNENNQH
jgi:hypothetical protein